MKASFFAILIFLVFASCSQPEARRPITASKTYTLAATSEGLKKINKIEETKILDYIKKDSLHNYDTSPFGYWFQYVVKKEGDISTPKKGDVVEISYEITDLNHQVIYSKEELGIKRYKVDKEDFIPALQIGIKTMKVGETIKFVIPSHNAFGVVGDENRIGMNQSLISTVTLININKNED